MKFRSTNNGRRKPRALATSLDAFQKDAILRLMKQDVPRQRIAKQLGLTKSLVDDFHNLTLTKQETSNQAKLDRSFDQAVDLQSNQGGK